MNKKLILLALFISSNFTAINAANAHTTKYPEVHCDFLKTCDHLASGIGYGYLSCVCRQFANDISKDNYLITDIAALAVTLFALDFELHSRVHLAQVSSLD